MSERATNSTDPKIGIAVTTVGRWDDLRKLLDDLAGQTQPPRVVAVAHHDASAQADLDTLVQSFVGKLTIRCVLSPRGISNGRNAAAAALGDEVDWICFPNDTSRIDPDFLERIGQRAMPDKTVCATQLIDREGNRNALPPVGSPLTRRTVWGAQEPSTMIRRQDFVQVGGFDTSIGSGAETPWQAGEGTDLILRLAQLDGFSIEWIPDIYMRTQTEFTHLTPSERRRKIRRYGRGSGHLYRKWRYSAWDKFRHVFGAALAPILKPGKFQLRDGIALAVGRAEGVSGRVLPGGNDNRAIVR